MSLLHVTLKSPTLYANTHLNVLIPNCPKEDDPSSFYSSGERFKVLWLLHGGESDYSSWERKSRIEEYTKDRKVIVVMPEGYNLFYTNWPDTLMNWETYFIEELMPFVYNWLPASSAREDNFIAGLSMGGIGAAKFAAAYPEKFAGAAVLSVAPLDFRAAPTGPRDTRILHQFELAHGGIEKAIASTDNAWDLMLKNKNALPDLYFSCGLEDDHYDQVYLKFKNYALAQGIPATFVEYEGYEHEWSLWDQEILKAIDRFGI